MRTLSTLLLTLPLVLVPAVATAAPTAEDLARRDRGFAELENENPDRAADHYVELIASRPNDPLGHANLAIALLRQQRYDEALDAVAKALELAPDRPDLVAIRGEIRQWQGELDAALVDLAAAADGELNDPERLYAAYQLAGTLRTPEAEAVADRTLERLARLRPDNLVVLLQRGQRAIAEGDRTTATGVFLRVRELLWQAAPIAERAIGMVFDALEGEDVSAARVPAVRLENVLKVSAMFRESLRELKTGIQGIPVKRFVDEPEPTVFGDPRAVGFTARLLDETPILGRGVAIGDLDADDRPDLVLLRADGLVIRLASTDQPAEPIATADGLDRLHLVDLDNDVDLDIVATGPDRAAVWLGDGTGNFTRAEDDLGLATAGARGVVAIDFDIEGDLDLATVGGASGPADLWRNSLDGPLDRVGTKVFPALPTSRPEGVVASDIDRDGDLDLLIAHARGAQWLANLRQGRFVDRSVAAGLTPGPAARAAASVDLDADGLPEAIVAGDGVKVWRNLGGRFEPWSLPGLPDGSFDTLHAFDADNDGRHDLVMSGSAGLQLLGRTAEGFQPLAIDAAPTSAHAVAIADLDADGDLDLVTGGPNGVHQIENLGTDGTPHHFLALRLRGLDKGSSKNNAYGVGSTIEVRAGEAYQFIEADGDVVHVGLGDQATARTVRVVWTNGVPQHRIDLAGDQVIVEEQLLKGSCPFLYTWDGERFAFVTDLLWGAPIGLPAAPGAWVSSDPSELVRVDGAVPEDGVYHLRITEELWEAAFFDRVRLWVVDHPADVEVASSLRIVPGATTPETVLASRALRPVAAAADGRGRDVTSRVAARDEVYADGYPSSPYQGVSEPWSFTVDLGTVPADPVRLHLDGWIFPADASLNLAVAQRSDYPYLPPRVEVETDEGWQTLVESMGFPAGKTKTMVVDLPPLPTGATGRLRLVTSLWLHWDRIAWTARPADDEPIVRARLDASRADLRYRGFSAPVRLAPNAPHAFDYSAVHATAAAGHDVWLPFPGRYTRYGDVLPLLAEAEDFSVILAAGDEIALDFDASELSPPAEGWRRSVFLESHGWDKDADRNTGEGLRLEPLPFHAMSRYPYGPDERYPDTPGHRRYVDTWLTREIAPDTPR
ncbi:MAG: FG-GAP-like repeat-containing protein [Acidobacteriota bacterium]